MIKLNKKWYYISIIFILLVLGSGGYYMSIQKYQMAIFVTPESESDPEWPSKRKWFDASEWLKTSQYIKINDFNILNMNYFPIEDVNDFDVTLPLQRAISQSVDFLPELSGLNRMDSQAFHQYMKNKLSYEYLRTGFNNELKPTNDYFLIYFTYKGVSYEVELLRKTYNGGFLFSTNGSTVDKAGEWHSPPSGYSYKDYMAGKEIKNN